MKVCWKWVQGNITYNPPYRTDQNLHASHIAHLEFKTMIEYWPAAGSCLWCLTQLRTTEYWIYVFEVQVWSVNILMFLYLPYKGKFMNHSSATTWVITYLQKCMWCTLGFIYTTVCFISETLNFFKLLLLQNSLTAKCYRILQCTFFSLCFNRII